MPTLIKVAMQVIDKYCINTGPKVSGEEVFL